MKHTILVKKEIEITTVTIQVPVLFGEEDIPKTFPGRVGNVLTMEVEIDTGKVIGWPQGEVRNVFMKVCDGGTYSLKDENGEIVARIVGSYVPGMLIPGDYSDYIDLKIDGTGTILNWPKKPDVTQFFNREEQD